jgi:hypothetical protein
MGSENYGCNFQIGGSFLTVLFLIMFVLKVCGIGAVANWSWWWITAPLWGPFAVGLALVIFVTIIKALISRENDGH